LKFTLSENQLDAAILSDAAYRNACDAAVFFVFECGENDYSSLPSRRQFLRNYAGGRPLSLALLRSAWAACKQHEAAAERGLLFDRSANEPAVSEKGLDSLALLSGLGGSHNGEVIRSGVARILLLPC